MSYRCKTPILLLVFNRPDVTTRVFEAIRAAKPTHLYVAGDGPRSGREGEQAIVEEVRQVATNVDWDCEVETLFRETNLGCSKAVNGAITWFFENVEAGIILEDDTVPALSFFPYCEELLNKYADDDRVGLISGNNHLPEYAVNDSYLFSKFKWIWGWATWRRAWKNQDMNLDFLKSPMRSSVVANMGYSEHSINRWEASIQSIEQKRVNTWDYHWFLSLGAQNQLSIIPKHNLVANIGFGVEGATHCQGVAPLRYSETAALDFPMLHPKFLVPQIEHELMYEQILLKPRWGILAKLPKGIKITMKSLLHRLGFWRHR